MVVWLFHSALIYPFSSCFLLSVSIQLPWSRKLPIDVNWWIFSGFGFGFDGGWVVVSLVLEYVSINLLVIHSNRDENCAVTAAIVVVDARGFSGCKVG